MKKGLIESSHRLSIIISSTIIAFVQFMTVAFVSQYTLANMRISAKRTADEVSMVLQKPLYNVDDAQALLIAEAFLGAGRITGISIVSTASGTIIDRPGTKNVMLLPPERRDIAYNAIPLGTVELYFSDKEIVDGALRFFLSMVSIILAVIAANYLVNRFVVQKRSDRVFGQIKNAIGEIGAGRYDIRLGSSGYDDMDAIALIINDMADKVETKSRELVAANALLEQRVHGRTLELERALEDQRKLQDNLIESSRLSALGQLSAGMAHELNTPLGAIQSSSRTLVDFLDGRITELCGFACGLGDADRELFRSALSAGLVENRSLTLDIPGRKEIQALTKRLSESGIKEAESVAGLIAETGLQSRVGELVPLMGRDSDFLVIEAASSVAIARRMAEVVQESSRKAASVVGALRSYLSNETQETASIVRIDQDIQRVLTLMHNMLKHGVEVRTDLKPVHAYGSSDKLSQVWMNVIRNAAQAMDFSGTLDIGAERSGDDIVVRIIDTGSGISDEIKDRVFEPFFTTKRQGDGMGLGLDICKRIVEGYHGTIGFESRPGRTEFIIRLRAADDIDTTVYVQKKTGEPS
jgi:signal transduction histidine kinase